MLDAERTTVVRFYVVPLNGATFPFAAGHDYLRYRRSISCSDPSRNRAMESDLRFKDQRLAILVIRRETPLPGSIRCGGKQRIWKRVRVRNILHRSVCSDRDSHGEFGGA